jgi:PAS domain S-box-containing protein
MAESAGAVDLRGRAAEPSRRVRVLYAGRDSLVWNVLEHVPFVALEAAACLPDGTLTLREDDRPGGPRLRADAVVVDEHPGEANPLHVIKSIRSQAPELPVIVLTSSAGGEIETAVFESGDGDVVVKRGVYRRRLIATLERVHRQLELERYQAVTRSREALWRRLLDALSDGIALVDGSGSVVAMNAAARALAGAPAEVAGRLFQSMVAAEHRDVVDAMLARILQGVEPRVEIRTSGRDGTDRHLVARGSVLNAPEGAERYALLILRPAGDDAVEAAERTALAADVARLQDALEESEARRTAAEQVLERERGDWERSRETLRLELQDAGRALEASAGHKAALDAAHAELESAQAELAAARAQVQAAKAELHAARFSHAHYREQTEARVAALEKQLQDLSEVDTAERSRLAALVDAARAEVDTLQARCRALEDERRASQDQQDALRTGWEGLRAALDRQLNTAVAALRSEDDARVQLTAAIAAIRRTMGTDPFSTDSR